MKCNWREGEGEQDEKETGRWGMGNGGEEEKCTQNEKPLTKYYI